MPVRVDAGGCLITWFSVGRGKKENVRYFHFEKEILCKGTNSAEEQKVKVKRRSTTLLPQKGARKKCLPAVGESLIVVQIQRVDMTPS